jgi:hypothetical protein
MGASVSLKTFSLSATITTAAPGAVHAAVSAVLGARAVVRADDGGLAVEAPAVVGVEARELNRRLYSAVRGVDEAARLRAEWTSDGSCERFRGYVLVKGQGR